MKARKATKKGHGLGKRAKVGVKKKNPIGKKNKEG